MEGDRGRRREVEEGGEGSTLNAGETVQLGAILEYCHSSRARVTV